MRSLLALVAVATNVVAAEPVLPEHAGPTVACALPSYRYWGAAKLASRGGSKEFIVQSLRTFKLPGNTDQETLSAAEEAAEYALSHPRAQVDRLAEDKFVGCLKNENVGVDLARAPRCWRLMRILDEVIDQRTVGVSKEVMLERAVKLTSRNEPQGKLVRAMVEKVYDLKEEDLPMFFFAELAACLGSPPEHRSEISIQYPRPRVTGDECRGDGAGSRIRGFMPWHASGLLTRSWTEDFHVRKDPRIRTRHQ